MLKKRLEKIVRKEKKRSKSIWPCLNFEPPAHLFGFKAIILNIALCHQHLQPIMDEMHKKFRKNKESAREIFSWLQSEFKEEFDQGQIEAGFWGLMNQVLHWLVVNLKDMSVGELEEMFGEKCMKIFTKKKCRCI